MNVWNLALCMLIVFAGLQTDASAQSREIPSQLVNALVKGDVVLARDFKAPDSVSVNSRAVVLELVPAALQAKVSFSERGAAALLGYLGSPKVADTILKTAAPLEPRLSGDRRRFAYFVLAYAAQEGSSLIVTDNSVKRLETGVQTSNTFCPCWPIC